MLRYFTLHNCLQKLYPHRVLVDIFMSCPPDLVHTAMNVVTAGSIVANPPLAPFTLLFR